MFYLSFYGVGTIIVKRSNIMNREELLLKKERLEKELKEVDGLLSADKDEIKSLFLIDHGPSVDRLIEKIKRMKSGEDVTDSRKNQMGYFYLIFETIDGEFWKIVKGSNWCSSFLNIGKVSSYDDESYELSDNVEKKFYRIMESIYEEYDRNFDKFLTEKMDDELFDNRELCMLVAVACLEY